MTQYKTNDIFGQFKIINVIKNDRGTDTHINAMHLPCGECKILGLKHFFKTVDNDYCLKCARYPVGMIWENRIIINNLFRDKKTNQLKYEVKCLGCDDVAYVVEDSIRKKRKCSRCKGIGYLDNAIELALTEKEKSYIRGAKTRKLEYSISTAQFRKLIIKNCIYCNREPSSTPISWRPEIKLGGLDRLDSDKGYHEDNVVPCCYICNRAKSDMTLKEWFDYLERLLLNDEQINKLRGELLS